MITKLSSRSLLFATAFAVFSFSMAVRGNEGGPYSGIYADFADLTVNGESQASYQGTPTTGGNGSSFPVALGNVSSLILNGGEEDVYKTGSGNILNATLYYQIGSGSWNAINLPWTQNNYQGNGNNQQWATTSAGVNVLSGLTLGTATTLNFYWTAEANDGGSNFYWDDGSPSSPYTMTLTPVPEPITLALPLFGGLVLTVGVARRFIPQRAVAAV